MQPPLPLPPPANPCTSPPSTMQCWFEAPFKMIPGSLNIAWRRRGRGVTRAASYHQSSRLTQGVFLEFTIFYVVSLGVLRAFGQNCRSPTGAGYFGYENRPKYGAIIALVFMSGTDCRSNVWRDDQLTTVYNRQTGGAYLMRNQGILWIHFHSHKYLLHCIVHVRNSCLLPRKLLENWQITKASLFYSQEQVWHGL